MSPRRILIALLLAGLWVLFRPKTIICPQCRGFGAPPMTGPNGELYARICATCGASSTPDLPLFPMPEMDPTLSEGL